MCCAWEKRSAMNSHTLSFLISKKLLQSPCPFTASQTFSVPWPNADQKIIPKDVFKHKKPLHKQHKLFVFFVSGHQVHITHYYSAIKAYICLRFESSNLSRVTRNSDVPTVCLKCQWPWWKALDHSNWWLPHINNVIWRCWKCHYSYSSNGWECTALPQSQVCPCL